MMSIMSSVGRELERQGKISVRTGESYAERALGYLMKNYLTENRDSL